MLVLQGENIVLSRKRLIEIAGRFKGETLRLEGDQLDLTQLKQALESQSLFGAERLVVIENLFSRRPSKAKEETLHYLKAENPENLVIWEGKKIDGRTLASFNKAKVENFELTPFIFKFLDSLAPGNQKKSLTLLHQCLEQDLPEIVFYMLARQVRLLLLAKDLGKKGLAKMASWQQNKLGQQASKFELMKLLQLHQQLLKIDWQQKTGQSPLSLASQLDLLVASL